MPEEEKDERWTRLYTAVNHHTGSHWFTEFHVQPRPCLRRAASP